MNPVPLVLWLLAGSLLGLLPRLALGWSWPASWATGMLCWPPLMWGVGTLLDRHERGREAAPPEAPTVPPLVLETPPACPGCDARDSAEILYGLQGMSEELQHALDEGRIVLAGCLVYAGAPRWLCRRCGRRHGSALPPASSDMEPLRSGG